MLRPACSQTADLSMDHERADREVWAAAERPAAVLAKLPERPSEAVLAFATAPHRRPSPPQLHEQPRLSLEARRAHRGFLEFPIARQALLVVVPEYDRIAPPLAKPVRAGLHGLANGSLLQNFALAAAPARGARSLAGRA